MGRKGEKNTDTMFRGMFAYGITEDLQISFSVPAIFTSAPLVSRRTTAMIPGTPTLKDRRLQIQRLGTYVLGF